MAMRASTAVLDGMLDVIKESKLLVVCSCMPTTFAHSRSTGLYRLAYSSALTTALFTKANSSVTNGRKITIGQVASMTVRSSGTAKHVALNSSNALLYVTTCNTKNLTTSDTVTAPSWSIHVLQPTSST